MSSSETALELECRKYGLDIVEYPFYRVIQAFHTLLSLAAVPLLLHVQIKYIFGSTFHRNIKIILLTYYSLEVIHSTAYSTCQIYELIVSSFCKPCEFFPPIYLHIPVHLCISISNHGLILSLMAICYERTVATFRSKKYESNGIALGLFLFVLTILGIVAITCYLYKLEEFNQKKWSMSVIPGPGVKKANVVAYVNIGISLICIITLSIWSRINKRRCLIETSTLTSRYQTRENIIITEFATHIASLQALFFVLTSAGGVFARTFLEQHLQHKKNLYISIRHMCYMIPIFTFVLPIVSLRRLRYYRLHRDSNIRSIVTMESRGVAGARNYDEIIARSWQQR